MIWRWRLLILALFLVILLIFSTIWQFLLQPQSEQFAYEQRQEQNTGTSPLILVWTRIFREQSLKLGTDCPLYDKCTLSYDHGDLQRADAVIFHIPDIKWTHQIKGPSLSYDLPDLPDLPPQQNGKKPRINVFLTQENPATLAHFYNSGQLASTSRNYFHWVMSYLHNSHLPMPYGGFWVSPEETTRLGFPPIQLPNDAETILRDKKTKGILWMASNCDSSSKREIAVQALSRFIPITVGGKCAKTVAGQQLCPKSAPNCDRLFAQHFFYIAAENDNCRDYVTEKFWDRYKLPAVPIVMRRHIYERVVPNGSYIAMDDFEGPQQMAVYLNGLMEDDDAYLRHFQWRSQNWSIAPWNHEGFRIGQCGLCERLLRISRDDEPMPSPLPNAVQWFERESQCEGGEFAEEWAANSTLDRL